MNTAIRISRWLCAALLGIAAAQAQDFPAKSIRFVVPYPPGGVADTFSRTLSQQRTQRAPVNARGFDARIEDRVRELLRWLY